MGFGARADQYGATATGTNSRAQGKYSSAFGQEANAAGDRSAAFGKGASATSSESTALGAASQAFAASATAVGFGARADQYGATAMGVNSRAQGKYSTAVGQAAQATGDNSVALGDQSVVDGKESIAIGKSNKVSGNNSIAVGTGHTIGGDNSGAFGDPNIVNGNNSYAVGNNNTVNNDNAFVLGNGVTTTQDNSNVLGNLSTDRAATTETGITINGTSYTYAGQGSATNGVMSVGFVGGERQIINVAAGQVSASSTDAINGSQLFATNEAIGNLSGTVNDGLNFVGDTGTAVNRQLGDTLSIEGGETNTTKLATGNNVGVSTNTDGDGLLIQLAKDIDLGADGSLTTGRTVVNNNGISILGGSQGNGNPVRLTKDGLFNGGNTIKGVGDGRVDATSNQAINGSQLFNQGKGVETIIGGTTVYDPTTGTFTNTDIGGTGKNNINDAIGAAYTAAGQAKSTVSGSANVTINKTGPANGPNDYQVVINDDINLDSVTTGNTVMDNAGVAVDDGAGNSSTMTTAGTTVTNADGDTSSYGAGGMVAGNTTDGKSTVVNQDGVSFTDADGDATGPTITAGGIDAGDTVITGVANGEVSADSTDAINGSQLNAVSETANRGFDITTAATGTGTVSGTTVANVAPGSLQTVTAGNNISISQNGIGLTIATNPDLVADSLTTGNTTVNNDGLSFTDGTGAATGPSISVDGINAGNTVVTGVANGEVSADSTDAVNGSQLNTTNNNVANNTSNINKGINFGNGSTSNNYALGNTISVTGDSNITTTTVSGGVQVGLNENIDLGSTGSVTTGNTVVNNNGVTITNGPSLTTNGINAGGQVVTGVADGIIADGSTDAINGGQLNTFGNQVNNALNDLGYRVDEVEDEANAGISAAMAMSSIPQSFIPGKSLIGGGIATYNGEGAVAVGLSKVSDNGRWVMKITGTADTQGNAGGAIGAGFHF